MVIDAISCISLLFLMFALVCKQQISDLFCLLCVSFFSIMFAAVVVYTVDPLIFAHFVCAKKKRKKRNKTGKQQQRNSKNQRDVYNRRLCDYQLAVVFQFHFHFISSVR